MFGRLKVSNYLKRSKYFLLGFVNCTFIRQLLYIRSTMKLVSNWLLYLVLGLVLGGNENVNSQSINALTFGATGISQAGVGGTKLANGDILVAGYAEIVPGNSDFSISKLSASGQFKWTYYSGTPNNDLSSMMDYDGRDKIYLCGTTFSMQNFNVGLVICFDTVGNALWQQSYSLPNSSISLKGIERTSSGLMLVGNYSSPSNNGNDVIMLMADSLGTLLHYHIYGDPTVNEIASGMTMVGDTIAFVACDKFVGNAGYNAYVLACDTSGTQLWETTLTSRFNSGSKNLMIDQYSNVIVVGEMATDSSSQFDIQISKLDLLGNLLWIRTITGSNNSDAGFAVCNSLTGNYILTGFFYDTLTNSKKILLLETDTACSLVQMQLYGNSVAGIGMSIEPSGNSYLIVGSDLTGGLYQVVFDSLTSSTSMFETSEIGDLNFYPNPFSKNFTIETNPNLVDQITKIELFDMFGRQHFIQNPTIKTNYHKIEIPENVNEGIVLVRIHLLNHTPYSKQMILVK